MRGVLLALALSLLAGCVYDPYTGGYYPTAPAYGYPAYGYAPNYYGGYNATVVVGGGGGGWWGRPYRRYWGWH